MSDRHTATASAAPDATASHDVTPDALGGITVHVPDAAATDMESRRDGAYFRALADQSLDIISVLDALGTIRFESPSVERWTGWKPEELVGRSAFEMIHPGDYAKVVAQFAKGILLPGSIEVVQYRFRHKNGSWRVLESWGKNLLTDKLVRGVIVNSRDVTERLQQEHRYRTLVERLPVAVLIHQEGRIVFANPAAVKVLAAKDVESLLERGVLTLVPPHTRAVVAERIEQAQRGASATWMEQQVVRLDGTMADVDAVSLGATHDGKPAVQTILHEITERKRAERQQAVQYAATRVLAQSQPDTIEQFLRIICEGLQWKIGELWLLDPIRGALRRTAFIDPAEPDYGPFISAAADLTCCAGEGLPGRVWSAGQALWIEDVTSEPIFKRRAEAAQAGLHGAVAFPVYAGETFSGVIQVFSPTSTQPDAQMLELLKMLGTQLGQFLERRQIQEQLLQAQKMEAVGQLAGGVAHDFNNLLTIINGHTALALTAPGVSAEVRSELAQVSAAVACASNLTRRLLTFSRKQVMQKRSLLLGTVIEDVARMLRRIIGEQVVLTLKHGPDVPSMDADVGMIEQIIMNLCVNARDAMPNGGRLVISAEACTVEAAHSRRVPQARQGRFVRLEVRDNGCGIPAEILPHVFEPFFTTKPAGRGTGLGLATVYGIVKQHDGWIEVDSQPHVGTAFRIYFPAAADAPAQRPAANIAATARGNNQTILVVEDETAVRVLARKLLERAGYRILEAGSGHEALQIWQKERASIDLILTDMVMPGGMTGRQLGERLRVLHPAVRMIYTSGYSSELTVTGCNNIPFLPKPYTPPELLQIIAETLKS